MIERIYIPEDVNPIIFYGVNNSNMQLAKTLFPELRIAARGSVMKAIGDGNESEPFLKKIREVGKYCEGFSSLSEGAILGIIRGEDPMIVKQENLIIHGMSNKPITVRTEDQQLLVKAFENNNLAFATGLAGLGKAFIAITLAVKALKNKGVRKTILSYSAVEAGEKLGFLPGEIEDRLDLCLQPPYDALQNATPATKLKEYMENSVIQIAPSAFMRGRTSNDAIIILDETQSTATYQIKMFLTRLSVSAKIIVTGNVTQIDLPPSTASGLIQAMQILKSISGISKVEFTRKDIVRHKLIQRIIKAYDKFDDKREKGIKEAEEKKTSTDNN